jgi:hypothetical protein
MNIKERICESDRWIELIQMVSNARLWYMY